MTDWQEISLSEFGFYGYFQKGTTNADKAMIVMSGSDGYKELAMSHADIFIDEGYSVLVLGFHKWEGLSQDKSHIPVDYMENAVKWLLGRSDIGSIGIKGTSMGAQYALLCASLIPEISLVIAASPFDHVLECVDDRFRRTGRSTYTYQGEEIPYSPSVLLDESVPKLILKCAFDKHYGLKRMFRFYYDKNPLVEESRVKVENMKADVLLIASENDDCWPAEISARRVEAILKKNNYPYRAKTVIYEKGSHAVGNMLDDEKMRKALKRIMPAEKKYPLECEQARIDSVRQIKDFLKEWSN
ncbi:MAG: hypothetical protein IJZ72_10655 [Oscillospiraceae bacterium]|nr:hypothetical protein [Oscillospiraceae bacterium]